MRQLKRQLKKKISKRFKKTPREIQNRLELILVNIFTSFLKPLSRLVVRIFEAGNIKKIIGIAVVFSIIFIAILPVSFVTAKTVIYKNYSQIQSEPTVITTEKSIRLPVNSFAISQSYNFFHPGIDLAAVKGSPVYPIMEGRVVSVDHGKFGYGNCVIVDHGSGLKSLYAHFAKIEARTGEKVNKDSILGLVGSTGWSTGPHLHLQIFQENNWINPRVFFEGYFGQKLASVR